MAAAVWLSRTSRWLEALFNVKGGAVQFDINPSLQPVIVWKDGQDSMATAGWNRYMAQFGIPAVAAQVGIAQLRNPSGSNVLAVIEKANVSGGLADLVISILQANATDLATAIVSQRADPRGQLLPTCILTSGNAAAATGGHVGGGAFPNSGVYEFISTINQEIVLAPGDAYKLANNTVNQSDNYVIQWRERAMQSSELS